MEIMSLAPLFSLGGAALALVGCGSSLTQREGVTDALVVETRPAPTGAVRLALTALLIAPGKSTGRPWDGMDSLPDDVSSSLARGLSQRQRQQIFRGFASAGTSAVLASIAPWAVGAVNSAYEPPDVYARISINGEHVGVAGVVQDTLTPTWTTAYTPALVLSPATQLEIDAVDADVFNDDPIGACTIRGITCVDANGYVAPEDFACAGQLWGVRLRVVEETGVQRVAVPSDRNPAIRRGGAGESCTRTDDCTAPLRCVQHTCVE
jgi:hypothetical protein